MLRHNLSLSTVKIRIGLNLYVSEESEIAGRIQAELQCDRSRAMVAGNEKRESRRSFEHTL